MLASVSCFGQAPKRTNLIKVTPVSFRQVANKLLDSGYQFKSIDSNFQTIKTEPKRYSRKTNGMIQLNIRVVENTMTVSGYCGYNESDFSANPGKGIMDGKQEIENRGMKGSLLKESFEIMDRFAKSLGGKIVYISP